MIFTSNRWSIDLKPSWSRANPLSEQPGTEAIAFAPNSSNALLTITTFDPSQSGISAEGWVEWVARVNRQKTRIVESAQIGDFSGIYVSFDAETAHIRAWALRFADETLDITFRCDVSTVGRFDVDVDTMLSTVRRVIHTAK